MSAVEICEALLTEEREAYAAYLLAWSRKPIGNPLTYEEWISDRD